MECPKCRHPQADGNAECARCGLVFSKYRPGPPRRSLPIADAVPAPPSRLSGILAWLVYTKPGAGTVVVVGRAVLLLVLFAWSWAFWLSPPEDGHAGRSFLHLVNLPFHEAGHVFARPLGPFMTSLGGSLGQLLMPLLCATVLLVKTRDAFGASVALWWMGENFLDLAPYIGDARTLSLPLLGGNTGATAPYGFHDWRYILTEAGLLEHDRLIAGIASATGTVLMVLSLAWGGFALAAAWRKRLSSPGPLED